MTISDEVGIAKPCFVGTHPLLRLFLPHSCHREIGQGQQQQHQHQHPPSSSACYSSAAATMGRKRITAHSIQCLPPLPPPHPTPTATFWFETTAKPKAPRPNKGHTGKPAPPCRCCPSCALQLRTDSPQCVCVRARAR